MRTIWYWSGVFCNQDRISTQKTANLNELNLNDFLIFSEIYLQKIGSRRCLQMNNMEIRGSAESG